MVSPQLGLLFPQFGFCFLFSRLVLVLTPCSYAAAQSLLGASKMLFLMRCHDVVIDSHCLLSMLYELSVTTDHPA